VIKVQVAGLEATLIQLKNSKVLLKDAAVPALLAAGQAYKGEVRRRIGMTCHTLQDLADLNHPYAKRHGTIQIHRRKPWQVHKQSGQMLSALRGRPYTQGYDTGYEVTFDYRAAPHALFVISGTRVMLPRDVLWETAMDPVTTMAMMKHIIKVLGSKLRTQLGVRFGAGAPTTTQAGSPGGSLGVS